MHLVCRVNFSDITILIHDSETDMSSVYNNFNLYEEFNCYSVIPSVILNMSTKGTAALNANDFKRQLFQSQQHSGVSTTASDPDDVATRLYQDTVDATSRSTATSNSLLLTLNENRCSEQVTGDKVTPMW